MKKFLIVIVCLFLVLNTRVNANPAQMLENLTAYEKSNATICIECEKEYQTQANIIENIWNNGDYEEAIELLQNSHELNDAAIGIQWKEPIRTSLRWGGDIRVGTRDSVSVVDLDVDNNTGYLFSVLKFQGGGNPRWSMNMSTDTGRTWVERFHWGSITSDVDGAVLGDYFYAAYSTTTAEGRIRRFYTSDGSADPVYDYNTVIDEEGVTLREISLTSNVDGTNPNKFLLYFSIMDNDSLRLYYNTDSTYTDWNGIFDPDVGNASRGLDACCAILNLNPFNNMWASYIGTDDSLYIIGGWSSWTNYGPLEYVGPSTYNTTSIGAYGDTVIAVHPYYNGTSSYGVRHQITYNNGSTWSPGILLGNSFTQSLVNDLTARNGDGLAVIYLTTGASAGAYYRHRSCSAPCAIGVTSMSVFPSRRFFKNTIIYFSLL